MDDTDNRGYDCEACVRCTECGRHWQGEPGWQVDADRSAPTLCPDHRPAAD